MPSRLRRDTVGQQDPGCVLAHVHLCGACCSVAFPSFHTPKTPGPGRRQISSAASLHASKSNNPLSLGAICFSPRTFAFFHERTNTPPPIPTHHADPITFHSSLSSPTPSPRHQQEKATPPVHSDPSTWTPFPGPR